MEENRPARQRQPIQKRGNPAIIDADAYISNGSSAHVKIIRTVDQIIEVELFFEKHYIYRDEVGENDGTKRLGIGAAQVEPLVVEALKHLLIYSACLPTFSFLNHPKGEHPQSEMRRRIFCQKESGEGQLNVLIQVNFISIHKYEITVITALCKNDFWLKDGEYAILVDGENSILQKAHRGNLTQVCSI